MQEKLQEEERLLHASREKINQLTHLILSSSGTSITPMFASNDVSVGKKKIKKTARRQTVCLSLLDGRWLRERESERERECVCFETALYTV
jgi:hypothetical protein